MATAEERLTHKTHIFSNYFLNGLSKHFLYRQSPVKRGFILRSNNFEKNGI